MGARFNADGDTWQVGLERHPSDGIDAVVFHCISNPQRPYRVLPVPDELTASGAIDRDLPPDQLRELFERSQIMDYTHDIEANPKNASPRTEP